MTTKFTEAGTAVEGTYLDIPFTGTVVRSRAHTINHDVVLVLVDLAEPIDVFGRVEDGMIQVSAAWDGGNPDSFGVDGHSIRVSR